MRVVVMIQGSGADEDKIAPTQEMLAQMGEYNEQLVQAGIMLDGQGLQPTSRGARVVFRGGETSVVDGPFTESKEIVAGYWIWQVRSLDEAIEWLKRAPFREGEVEIRPIFEADDFGEEFTPELREQEARLREQAEGNR